MICCWTVVLSTLSEVRAGMPVRAALAQIESGASGTAPSQADHKIGRSGEVSRYQIMPRLWHRYTRSRNYQNPDLAWTIAARILEERKVSFQRSTGRRPDPIDLYLVWNAPGLYARCGYDRSRVHYTLIERAQRYANLIRN